MTKRLIPIRAEPAPRRSLGPPAPFHFPCLPPSVRRSIMRCSEVFMLSLLVALFLAGAAFAEEPRPPVVLVDGYYPNCSNAPFSSNGSFGRLETYLRADGIRVEFFRPCSVPSSGGGRVRATLEELGQALGKLVEEIGA